MSFIRNQHTSPRLLIRTTPKSEAAKREFFERNFAWHVITQYDEPLTCTCDNATVMFLKPVADPSTKERLGSLKTGYNMKKEPIITSAFYFDLALRSFLAVKFVLKSLLIR